MLVEYQTDFGYSSEIDLFIAQTVLQFLCLRNKETAKTLLKHYIKIHPDIEQIEPPFKWPLINFIWFLFLALDE